ncbi:hypothetical protein DFP74_2324 [Nocardiopsis sp. Huas11]|nr:hypothetical protein DFP74_2324 [Nocardiopsis sp. Huas11]
MEELARLKAKFGDRYIIRCTRRFWIATDRDCDTTTEPTLIENSAAELEAKMRDPGPRVGVPYSSEVLGPRT